MQLILFAKVLLPDKSENWVLRSPVLTDCVLQINVIFHSVALTPRLTTFKCTSSTFLLSIYIFFSLSTFYISIAFVSPVHALLSCFTVIIFNSHLPRPLFCNSELNALFPLLCSHFTNWILFLCITPSIATYSHSLYPPLFLILLTLFPKWIKFLSHLPLSQILSGVMLEVLSEDFPEFFPAEVQMVWTKLMGAVYWHVTGAYTEVGWLQVSSSAVWSEEEGFRSFLWGWFLQIWIRLTW